MINKIVSIKNLGIYNFEEANYDDFLKYNLFYGFNGSGKSTLSRLFGYIGGLDVLEDDAKYKATVVVNKKRYTNEKFNNINEIIRVFNDDFVDANIDFDGVVKSILLLGNEKKADVMKYKSLKQEIEGSENEDGLKQKIQGFDEKLRKLDSEKENILSKIAKGIKDNFANFKVIDQKYRNYTKTVLKRMMETTTVTEDNLLDDEERIKNINEIIVPRKEKLQLMSNPISIGDISDKIHYAEQLLSKRIIAEVIDDLKNDSVRSNWVKEGLYIHKNRNSDTCLFCGNKLSDDLYKKLENHFNDNLKILNQEINDITESLTAIEEDVKSFYMPADNLFHESIQNSVRGLYEEKHHNDKIIKELIDAIIKDLNIKLQKPFDETTNTFNYEQTINKFKEFAAVFDKLNVFIAKHNVFIDEYEKRVSDSKDRLEKHLIANLLKNLNYHSKNLEYDKLMLDCQKAKKSLERKEKEIRELEESLSREQIGADIFNEELYAILGHKEIHLVFDVDEKGYEIFRKDKRAKRLSEGEKTAIAFVYFMTKLKEDEDNFGKLIVVIDDPVSSFDSNKIFHVYSYIKNNLENIGQLFLLTHNYTFFSMFHEWITNRTKKVDGKNVPNWKKYLIDNIIVGTERYALIKNGNEALNQSSEYDYLFQTLYKYKNSEMSEVEMLFCANSCRRLLESFLSFKFPKQRGNLRSLLDVALKDNPYKADIIYKYINKGSHASKINVVESSDSNLFLDNDKKMIDEIFEILENLDERHYNDMKVKAEEALSQQA